MEWDGYMAMSALMQKKAAVLVASSDGEKAPEKTVVSSRMIC